MSYMIRHSNGVIENRMKCVCFWAGSFSTVYPNGEIFNYVLRSLNRYEEAKVTFFMPQSDGDIMKPELNNIYTDLDTDIDTDTDSIILIGSVAQRFYETHSNIRYLLLPQDDGIFEHGLRHYISSEKLPKWENRIPKLFWRGSGSRRNGFLRKEVVMKLLNNSNTDVKLISNWIYPEDNIPENAIGDNVNYMVFANYKMVLIVDGNGISSAHSWCFGIGCVPFMITNNDFWFKDLLVPFGNYIPIKYDLSDLEEKIEWVLEHDDAAREIAERAFSFAYKIFTTEYQKKYIDNRVCEIIGDQC